MGGKAKTKKAGPAEKPEVVPRKVEEPEFTQVAAIPENPYKEPEKIEMPKKKEQEDDQELGKAELLPKNDFAKRIEALRARMKDRTPKYHRGDVASRPHKTKKESPTYLDRMSRLGGIAGRRPEMKKGAGAQRKPREKPPEIPVERETGPMQMAKLDEQKKRKKQD